MAERLERLLCFLGFHNRQCEAHYGWYDEWCARCGKHWRVPWLTDPATGRRRKRRG